MPELLPPESTKNHVPRANRPRYQQDSPQYSLCYPGQLPPAALAYVVRAAGSHRKAGDRNRQPGYRLKGSVDIQIGQGTYGNVHTTEHQADNIGSQHPPSVLGPGGPPAEVGILANTSPDRVLQGHHRLARGISPGCIGCSRADLRAGHSTHKTALHPLGTDRCNCSRLRGQNRFAEDNPCLAAPPQEAG